MPLFSLKCIRRMEMYSKVKAADSKGLSKSKMVYALPSVRLQKKGNIIEQRRNAHFFPRFFEFISFFFLFCFVYEQLT